MAVFKRSPWGWPIASLREMAAQEHQAVVAMISHDAPRLTAGSSCWSHLRRGYNDLTAFGSESAFAAGQTLKLICPQELPITLIISAAPDSC
jgi:hypothetical protein